MYRYAFILFSLNPYNRISLAAKLVLQKKSQYYTEPTYFSKQLASLTNAASFTLTNAAGFISSVRLLT